MNRKKENHCKMQRATKTNAQRKPCRSGTNKDKIKIQREKKRAGKEEGNQRDRCGNLMRKADAGLILKQNVQSGEKREKGREKALKRIIVDGEVYMVQWRKGRVRRGKRPFWGHFTTTPLKRASERVRKKKCQPNEKKGAAACSGGEGKTKLGPKTGTSKGKGT